MIINDFSIEWIPYPKVSNFSSDDTFFSDIINHYKDGWVDAVMGPLEFSVYACSTYLAIQKKDPDYLNREPKYLQYINYELNRSWKVFQEGSKMDQFRWDKQDEYLAKLRKSSIVDVFTFFNMAFLV